MISDIDGMDTKTIVRVFDWIIRGAVPCTIALLGWAGTQLYNVQNRVTLLEATSYTQRDAQIEREAIYTKLDTIKETMARIDKEMPREGGFIINLAKQVESLTAEMRDVNRVLRERQ